MKLVKEKVLDTKIRLSHLKNEKEGAAVYLKEKVRSANIQREAGQSAVKDPNVNYSFPFALKILHQQNRQNLLMIARYPN